MLAYEVGSQIADGLRAFSEPPAPARPESPAYRSGAGREAPDACCACRYAFGLAVLFLAGPFWPALYFFGLSLVGVPSVLSCRAAHGGSRRCRPTPSSIGLRYRRLSRTGIAPSQARFEGLWREARIPLAPPRVVCG